MNYTNGTFFVCFLLRYKDWKYHFQKLVIKEGDRGGEQNTEHDKQNLQESLMGPSGWQKKKQSKDKSLGNCQS